MGCASICIRSGRSLNNFEPQSIANALERLEKGSHKGCAHLATLGRVLQTTLVKDEKRGY